MIREDFDKINIIDIKFLNDRKLDDVLYFVCDSHYGSTELIKLLWSNKFDLIFDKDKDGKIIPTLLIGDFRVVIGLNYDFQLKHFEYINSAYQNGNELSYSASDYRIPKPRPDKE